MTDPLHDDELMIDLPLVRGLVGRAFPAWSSLSLRPLRASGSSNALFRLGDELLVRLPRQPGGSEAIEKEKRWLPRIAPLLPVPVPDVVSVGEPALGYPEKWSVVHWLDGDVATAASYAAPSPPTLARDLAALVTALHGIEVPAAALAAPELRHCRGEPLASMDETVRSNVTACRAISALDLDLDAALRIWDEALALPDLVAGSRPRWLHGDLLAENLLVRDGRLSAVLDFGGLAVGNPTVDLVVAWEVLDASSREVFRRAAGVDEQSWLRGRAWALAVALMTFPYYWRTMPQRCADRLAMARAVLADAAP